MQNKENLKEIYQKLPFGSQKRIAKISNTTVLSVRKFFCGELKNLKKIEAISKATIKLYRELKKEQKQLNKITGK